MSDAGLPGYGSVMLKFQIMKKNSRGTRFRKVELKRRLVLAPFFFISIRELGVIIDAL